MNDLKDAAYMQMAYGLAEKAIGGAGPNPYVGALVVKNDVIVGHGYHLGAGHPHAETLALMRAGARAHGATLYVTLEPCVHWGRTPPCVDAVLTAGLKKVVVSALDPNPLVFRKGIRALRRAGLDVTVGLLAERNRRLNEYYIKYITRKIPFVTLKAALSLDGKMATKTFDSRWISAEATREYAHLLRGECDALLVGINTILRDDPRLTVRHPNWPKKRIARVVLDAGLRIPLKARILSTLPEGKIIVFAAAKAPLRKKEALTRNGVEVISLPARGPRLDLGRVLAELGTLEIASLLVEGGGQTATAFLERKLADKVLLSFSPRLIGGRDAVSFFGGAGAAGIKDALRLRTVSLFRIGEDALLEGYF
jgi:diaminohydroxyphosphoribosylaminopyrimidine deaminase / 5-amino-6-(5-phosphoribosylamino)uracil reductase